MFKKPSYYIIQIRDIKEKDVELVGRESMASISLHQSGVRVPESFVITTFAFDDFILGANLIDPIADVLRGVRPFIHKSALDASEKIAAIVYDAKLPRIIEEPIIKAYLSLAKSREKPIVSLRPSNVIESRFLAPSLKKYSPVDVLGEKDLIHNLKLAWLSLFATEAIELRANGYYDGDLSVAVVVQNNLKSELSGKVYSIPPITKEENLYEVDVMYGIPNKSIKLDEVGDIYKVTKAKPEIVEKIIVPQEKMVVRSGKKSNQGELNIEVEISNEWQKRQKVDDKKVLEVVRLSKKLEQYYKSPLEVNFAYEVGNLFIESVNLVTVKKEPISHTGSIKVLKDAQKAISDEGKKTRPNLKKLEDEIRESLGEKSTEVLNEETIQPERKPLKKFHFELPQKSITKKSGKSSYLDWLKDYDLKTDLYYDLSDLSSASLTNAGYFDGAFIDGTEIILNFGVLPEEHLNDTPKLNQLIESYCLDIVTAARSVAPNPLIYQFSNITENEYKLLGAKSQEHQFNGDERFINIPKVFSVEALALKKAVSTFGWNNISISLPFVRTFGNFVQLQRLISSNGLKRSLEFKTLVEYAIPSLGFELEKFNKSVIDSLVINYDELAILSTYKNNLSKEDHESITAGLDQKLNTLRRNDINFLIRIAEFDAEVLKSLVGLKPSGLIFSDFPKEEDVRALRDLEKKEGSKKKKD